MKKTTINYLNDIEINKNTKAIIFDCYGTLLEIKNKTNPYQYLLEQLINGNIKINTKDYYEFILTNNTSLEIFETKYQYNFDTSQKTTFKNLLNKEINSIQIYEDVNKFIQGLKRYNIKSVMCSNLATPYVNSSKNLTYPLDYYVFSCNEGVKKSNNEIYKLCLNYLNFNEKDVIFVGDSYKNDYQKPIELGFSAYWIKRNKENE